MLYGIHTVLRRNLNGSRRHIQLYPYYVGRRPKNNGEPTPQIPMVRGASSAAMAANRIAKRAVQQALPRSPIRPAPEAGKGTQEDDIDSDDEEIERRRARLEKMREELDTDKDGNISREELRAWKAELGAVKWLPYRRTVKRLYDHRYTQMLVSLLIVSNFIVACVQRQIDPYNSDHQQHDAFWTSIDDAFTVCFMVELAINMYGSFAIPFFSMAWNYLDLVVVMLGIFSLMRVQSVSQLSFVRVIRTFRVVRLFKRLKSLNAIINALIKSLPGVASAFLIMLIVMSIYAIISVDLFRDFGRSGEYVTSQIYGEADAQYGVMCSLQAIDCTAPDVIFRNSTAVTSVTNRGIFFGQEYYGTFSRALYTQLQVLTGESWSEAVARPLLMGTTTNAEAVGVAVLFVTYIIITQVILQNVVVAVLIEKFTDGKQSMDEEELTRDLQLLHKMALGKKANRKSSRDVERGLDSRVMTNINAMLDSAAATETRSRSCSKSLPTIAGTNLPTWAAATAENATPAAVEAHATAVMSATFMSGTDNHGCCPAFQFGGLTTEGNATDTHGALVKILEELAHIKAEQRAMVAEIRQLASAVGTVHAV